MDSKLMRVICSAFLVFAFVAVTGCGDDNECPSGQVMCGNKCVDWLTDDDHCGQCDNACGNYADCVNGQCSCVAGYSDCSGQCVNLNFDRLNCGTCGNACPGTDACVNGVCDDGGCPQGFTDCSGTCVNLTNDEAHCGTCTTTCRADQVCSNSACACFGGETECTGECVDLLTDSDNCGACGTACTGATPVCDNGTCVGGCPNTMCGTDCVDTNTSNAHCGACDNACDVGNGFVCQNGTCACFSGEECVTGVCTDTDTDEANCGTCGTACRSDQYCNAGVCSCASGLSDCTTLCTDTDIDEANCGTCGTACRADEVCTGGTCGCPTGETDCTDGCVNLQTNHDNCGACDLDCGAQVCVAGVCTTTGCNPPSEMCGSDCVNTQTDPDHCGVCDNACSVADGFICQVGSCACIAGMTECSNVCVNTQADNNNCGSCGTTCSGGQYCSSGTCVCAGGLDFCGGNCTDTDSDEANCGVCGNQCSGGETCMSGQCIGAALDYVVLECPETAIPMSMTVQCSVKAVYIGGAEANVTAEILPANWLQDDMGGGVVDTFMDGLVTMSDSDLIGERENIWVMFEGLKSNEVNIQMVGAVLCSVKLVPETKDWAAYGQDEDFSLPYLASSTGDALTWGVYAVGIYRNNAACTQGGPYYKALTYLGTWNVSASNFLDVDAWYTLPENDIEGAQVEVQYQSTYPTASQPTTVIYNYNPGTGNLSDELIVHVVPLDNAGGTFPWSITAEPNQLTIPAGKMDSFKIFMDFANNRIDFTQQFHNLPWYAPWGEFVTLTEIDTPPDLVSENAPGYSDDMSNPLYGLWTLTAGQIEGSTTVQLTVKSAHPVATQETATEDVNIDVSVAVPVACKIYMANWDAADTVSQVYPEGHQAVQFKVKACMSTADCSSPVYNTDITEQDWGNGWMVDFSGTGGGLGTVDAYGGTAPGLWHIPADAPQNPDPQTGAIQYHFGPDVDDFCEIDVSVLDRYLCEVDLRTTQLDEDGNPTTIGRRLWSFNDGRTEGLLPNENGWTQQFFVYGTFGTLDGSGCDSDNQYFQQLAYSDVTTWDYNDTAGNGTGNNPIFGASGVNTTTGIGTVVENAGAETNRVEEVRVYVDSYPHIVDGNDPTSDSEGCDTVNGCWDSVIVNACGVLPASPQRKLADTFTETSVDGYTENTVVTYAGDNTTNVFALARYEETDGCYGASNSSYFWYEVSTESNVRFSSQASTTASIDNDGLIDANQTGQTLLEVNWDGGAVEDNLPITVVAALVEEFNIAPVSAMTSPRAVTYAPGSPIIPLQAQFFGTVTLTNGNVMDVNEWLDNFPASYQLGNNPTLTWGWCDVNTGIIGGACNHFVTDATFINGGIITPDGSEGNCLLSAICNDCGPEREHVYPGVNVYDNTAMPDWDLIDKTWVEAVEATMDCSTFFIQTPLMTCYDPPAAPFVGYAIDATTDSEMNLYACIGYDNGVYRALDWMDTNNGVDWTASGGVSNLTNNGLIGMDGNLGTVYAAYSTCPSASLSIQADTGANYLQDIVLETLWNWNNCGTDADVCAAPTQTLQFIVRGDFGGGREMDLTTHTGTIIQLPASMVPISGGLPGFGRMGMNETASPPAYNEFPATASVDTANDTIDVRGYKVSGAPPSAVNVMVTDNSLGFSDYMGGNVSQISGTVTLTGITGATFNVTNDLIHIPSDVTYFRVGPGGWVGTGHEVGTSYNGNWFLLPNDAGSATGLSLEAEYSWATSADGWDNQVFDTITNISVGP